MAALCHFYNMGPSEARALKLREWNVFVDLMVEAQKEANG